MKKSTLLTYPEYIKFYASYFLGNVGDWFDFFALQIIFVHKFAANANGVVDMMAAYILPIIVLADFAGGVADKVNKKILMAVTDFFAGLLTIALIFSPNVTVALLLIIVRSCFIAFNGPAQRVTSRLLLPKGLQLKASSYEQVAFQLCRIVGPMLGAVVIVISSPEACLAVNAISFFVSVFFLLLMKPIVDENPDTEHGKNEGAKLKESNFKLTIRLIGQSRLLKCIVPLLLLGSLFIMTVELQMVILLKNIFPSQPHLLGYVVGFSAIGSFLSAAWLSRKHDIVHFGWYMVLCYLCVAVGYGFMGLFNTSWSLSLFLFASLLSGFGLGVTFVFSNYVLKREIASKQLGRVSGVMSIFQGVAYGIGVSFGGPLIIEFGARDAFIVVALICLVLAVLSMVLSGKMEAKA